MKEKLPWIKSATGFLKGKKQQRDWSTVVIVEISLKSICCCSGVKPENAAFSEGKPGSFLREGGKGWLDFKGVLVFFPTEQNVWWFLCLTYSCWPKGFVPPNEECRTGTWILLSNASSHHTFSENTNYNSLVKIRYMLICPLKISNSMQIENRCLRLQSVLVSLCT